MKFIQFYPNEHRNSIRAGYVSNNKVVELNCPQHCDKPRKMLQLLQSGIAEKITLTSLSAPKMYPLTAVTIVAPILGVDKILGVALNYADYCKDINTPPPPTPTIFSKFSSNIIGPDKPLRIRTDTCKTVDWEVELAVVIGKTASSVTADEANKYIFGYTIAQDICDREWQKQKNGTQFLLGKSLDTFCPIGPCIVTKDEVGDAHNLNLSCMVNGTVKQKSNTSNMIHTIPAIIERITSVMTLFPGDLILTGTPAGVGSTRNPPEYLQPGDVIRSEIQKIGMFETTVVEF